jgi:iron complex outermembrane receptor protein
LSKRIYIFLLSIGWWHIATAQSCFIDLSGAVTDVHDGSPMEQVSVYVQEVGREVWTNPKGQFSFDHLCPGTYHLTVQHIGCPLQYLLIELKADTSIALTMEHHQNMLHVVDVHDHHEGALLEQRISLLTLDEQQHTSFTDLLSTLSGVSALGNGADVGVPIVQGLSGNRMTIVTNGVMLTGQQWATDHSPEIDVNAAGEIAVVSGAATLRYPGTHMGGIVVLDAAPIPVDPHVHGKARTTLVSNGRGIATHVRLFKGKEQLQWQVGGTFKRFGDRRAPRYFLNNTGTAQQHVNAEVRRQWGEHAEGRVQYSFYDAEFGILRGSHIGNLTDLQSAFVREVPFYTAEAFSYGIEAPRQHVKHHTLKTSIQTEWKGKEVEWHLAGQVDDRKEFDVRRSGRSAVPALSLMQLSFQNEVLLSHQEHWQIGVQMLGRNNWNVPETGILPLLPNYTSFSNGLFALGRLQRNAIRAEWGARYDYTVRDIAALSTDVPREVLRFQEGWHMLSAVGSMAYRLDPKWEVLTLFALRERPPGINERYAFGLHQGVSGIEEGNIALDSERGIKASVQLRGRLNDRLHVELGGYAHYFDGYIYLQPQQEFRLTIRGAFPVFSYEQCDALLRGADLKLRYALARHWDVEATWAFVQGENRTEDLPLNFMPPLNAQLSLRYELPEWKGWRNMKLALDHRYAAQQTHWDERLDFMAPPAAYHVFDLSVGGTLKLWNVEPQLRLSVENIANTSYRDYLNRQRYFADALGRSVNVSWIQNF